MKKVLFSLQFHLLLTIFSILSLAILLSGCKKEEIYPKNFTHGKIVFSQYDNLNSDIYIIDHAGLTKIPSATFGYFKYPAWSPDGTQIAYVASDNISWGSIFTMDYDGSSQTLVLAPDSPTYWTIPSWSPDGEQLCLESFFSRDIYITKTDGTEVTKIGVRGGDPEWSPDGTQIVFWDVIDNNFEIFRANVDGSELTNLTNSSEYEDSPSWSTDGNFISFSRGGQEEGTNIYYMDADGANVTQVTQFGSSEAAFSPTWSPDDTQIAFVKDNGLYVVNIDGSNLQKVYEGGTSVSNPDWY